MTASAQLTFRNNYDLEAGATVGFDGGVLEFSTNGGSTWTDVIAGGGSFVANGYNRTISTGFGSPIAGRMAWSGNGGGYLTTTVNLPAALAGQSVLFRWRLATDSSVSDVGWRVDGIVITDGVVCSTTCGPCTSITCPANITQSNDPGQCGAVVNYPAPAADPACGTVTCSPPSGSFFPVGTTTVTCTAAAGPTCSFTVTLNDTEAPTITCPPNQIVCAAPGSTGTVVNYPAPTASDNCPGVTVACVPPSGSTLPPGATTVTCTATDASGNTASCSFRIDVFNALIQDDSNSLIRLMWITSGTERGRYLFCCAGSTFSGVGTAVTTGNTYTLTHSPADRRVVGKLEANLNRGNGSLQSPPGKTLCTIADRNTLDDLCGCAVIAAGKTGK
jgi:hypothetical protein